MVLWDYFCNFAYRLLQGCLIYDICNGKRMGRQIIRLL